MDQFICVRLVKANYLDLTLFQFDYDLTFAVFFLNADKTIYGRYGSRTGRDAEKDISLEGFAETLAGALELHRDYPTNKIALSGKQPKPTEYQTPNDYPSLQGRYRQILDYDNRLVQSCMHCHQINDAARLVYREQGNRIPDDILYPFPAPRTIGLSLDSTTKATISDIVDGSAVEQAGLRAGDTIVTLAEQPILSIADVQWVLHTAASPDNISATIRRGSQTIQLSIRLSESWRRQTDIAWRVSSWPLRRMGTGGLVLNSLTAPERRAANIDESALGLKVMHVGQYGQHAVAKQAGFLQDDIVIAFDGQTKAMTESELLVYAVQNTKPGERIPVTVLRGTERIDLRLLMQK